MHNLKDIRKDFDNFKKKINLRNIQINFDELIKKDLTNRELIKNKELLESEKKILSKSKDKKNFEKSKELSKKINLMSEQQDIVQKELDTILSNIPNIALESVPVGKDESSNKIIRKEGNVKKFNFPVKSHSELGEVNNNIDFKTASTQFL